MTKKTYFLSGIRTCIKMIKRYDDVLNGRIDYWPRCPKTKQRIKQTQIGRMSASKNEYEKKLVQHQIDLKNFISDEINSKKHALLSMPFEPMDFEVGDLLGHNIIIPK